MKFLLAGALLAFAMTGAPSTASIVHVTYTGTVESGYDQTGIFGPAGGDLAGLSYKASYIFDTTIGFIVKDREQMYTFGGTGYGNIGPVLSTTITIGGIPLWYAGQYGSEIFGQNEKTLGSLMSSQFHGSQDYYDNGITIDQTGSQTFIFNFQGVLPGSNAQSFSYAIGPNDYYNAVFGTNLYEHATGTTVRNTYASAVLETLTVSVPEPASWTLMIAGFGMVGASMRRRSRALI